MHARIRIRISIRIRIRIRVIRIRTGTRIVALTDTHVRGAKARIRNTLRRHERVVHLHPERERAFRSASLHARTNSIGQLAHRRSIAAQPCLRESLWRWRLLSSCCCCALLLLLLSLPPALLPLLPFDPLLLVQQIVALVLCWLPAREASSCAMLLHLLCRQCRAVRSRSRNWLLSLVCHLVENVAPGAKYDRLRTERRGRRAPRASGRPASTPKGFRRCCARQIFADHLEQTGVSLTRD